LNQNSFLYLNCIIRKIKGNFAHLFILKESAAHHHGFIWFTKTCIFLDSFHFYSRFIIRSFFFSILSIVWVINIIFVTLSARWMRITWLDSSSLNSLVNESISQGDEAGLNTSARLCRSFKHGEACSFSEFHNIILCYLSFRYLHWSAILKICSRFRRAWSWFSSHGSTGIAVHSSLSSWSLFHFY